MIWSQGFGPRSQMLRLILCVLSSLRLALSRSFDTRLPLCRSIPLFPWSRCIYMRHSPGHSRETICTLSSTLEFPSSSSLMILDPVFLDITFHPGKNTGKNNLLRTMNFQQQKISQNWQKKPPQLQEKRKSASRQLRASSLIWLLFPPFYLDTGGGWWCSWCIEFAGEVAFPSLFLISILFSLGSLCYFPHCLIPNVCYLFYCWFHAILVLFDLTDCQCRLVWNARLWPRLDIMYGMDKSDPILLERLLLEFYSKYVWVVYLHMYVE